MAMVSAPFTGDRTKIKQVDPGKFLDTATGNYYTGTFDNATNWGQDYAKIGIDSPTTTQQPGVNPSGASGQSNNPGLKSTDTGANPYTGLPGGYPSSNPYPGGTPPYLPTSATGTDYSKYSAPPGETNYGGPETQAPRMPAPPSGYHTDPTTGAWVWDGTGPQIQGPLGPILDSVRQTAAPTSTPSGDWIDQALSAAQSTDDPAYWRRVIAADPKVAAGDQSAIDYWKGRIAQGDGALAVRNGTAQRFQDGPAASTGARTLPGYQQLNPTQSGTAQDAVSYLNNLSHSLGGGDLSQAELAQYAAMVGYREGQPVSGAMINQIASAMMQARGITPPGTGATTPSPGGSYNPTNPFDDPATKDYIDLLNTRIQELLKPRQDPSLDAFMKMISDRANGLNTPYTNPDAGPLQDWLRQYGAQLQSPSYTDAQRNTIATQALDPMERQRQSELKNVANTMASRGITPGSGPYLQAERDINQKYDSLRAQTQAGLSVNEINQVRNDQAQSGNVLGQLANFTQGQFANNENRANQATQLFGTIPQLNLAEFNNQENRANQAVTLGRQIPDLAQSRIASATQLLNGSNVNPASLIQALQGFQQQGMQQQGQDSAFWQSMIANLAHIFGLG